MILTKKLEEINKFNQDPFPYRKTSVKKMQRNLLLDIFQHKTHTDETEKTGAIERLVTIYNANQNIVNSLCINLTLQTPMQNK